MNLNTLTSGLITDKYGLRPALLCATRRDLAKHSVIRVLTKEGSGWIGISYGKVITGAKYQEGSTTLNGVDALCKLLQATDGHFDLIQMGRRLLGDELSQDIGVSIDQLLDELKLQQNDALAEIIQRCKKNWESLYLLEGMTSDDDDLPADGNSHATRTHNTADTFVDDDDEYDDSEEWEVDDTEEGEWQIGNNGSKINAHPAAQNSPSQDTTFSNEASAPILEDDLRLEPVDGVDILQKNDLAFTAPNLAGSLAEQAARVEASITEADSTIYLSGPKLSQQLDGPIYLSGPTLEKRAEPGPQQGTFGDPEKMLPAEIPKVNSDPHSQYRGSGRNTTPRLRITKEQMTPGRGELSSLREEMQFELSEFVQSKLSSSGKLFQDVDIQEMTNYQSSVVLRDLENALVQARKAEEEAAPQAITQSLDRIPDRKRKMRKERIQVELEESRAELAALNADLDQAASGSFETVDEKPGLADKLANQIEVAKPKSRKTVGGSISELAQSGVAFKPDQIPEASRELFAEQVQKKVEVDPKAFLAGEQTPKEDEDLELKILKQKQFRQSIILASSTCLVAVALVMLVGNLTRNATLGKASEKITAGDLKGARTDYEKIIKDQPSNWQAYMGHAITMPDDPAKRIQDYEKVLSLKSDEMLAAMGIAKAYLDLHQYDKAAAAADKAAAIDKSNPEPHKLKGQVYLKQGKYQSAIDELKQGLALQRDHKDEIAYLISTAYRDIKQQKNQLAYLNQAIDASPKTATYLKDRAVLRFQAGDYKGAKADLTGSLSSNPGQGELHYILAQIMLRDRKTDQALDEMTKAINLGYATADSYGQRGLLYMAKRMNGEAKVDLEEATKANPKDRVYQRALAKIDAAIEAAKARAGTRRLIDSTDTDTISLKDIKGNPVQFGYDLIRQGKYNSAASVLVLAVRQNPNDAHARVLLAHAFYLGGNYAKASTEFSNVYRLQGLSVDDHFLYGRALSKAGRLEQAIDVLTNLVDQRPDFHKARVELIKAYSLSGFTDHAREQCNAGMKLAKTDAEYKQFQSLLP